MVGNDAGHDREPEPRSPPLRREVGQEELLAIARGMPRPVSATSIVTPLVRSDSRTTISPFAAHASRALSIRLIRTRLICSGSSWTRSRVRRDSTLTGTPSRAPSKRRTAEAASAARSTGSGFISGSLAKRENSSTSAFRTPTSSTIVRVPRSMVSGRSAAPAWRCRAMRSAERRIGVSGFLIS